MTHRDLEPGYYDNIISVCRQAGFNPKISQEAEGLFTILTLVAAGIGVSLVSSMAIEKKIPGIVYKELKGDRQAIELIMVWRKDNNSPIVKRFIEYYTETDSYI